MNNNIQEELNKPLDKKHVCTRKGRGRDKNGNPMILSYVEGWHVIAEMNRIFGFDGWSTETVYMQEIVNRKFKNKKGYDMVEVGYVAKVRIEVAGVKPKEGTGTGNGIASTLYDAYESAIKEAETDALKRACMKFGGPLGLALYDPEQANVVDYDAVQEAEEAAAKAKQILDLSEEERVNNTFTWLRSKLQNSKTQKELNKWVELPKVLEWFELVEDKYTELHQDIDAVYKAKLRELGGDNSDIEVVDPAPTPNPEQSSNKRVDELMPA